MKKAILAALLAACLIPAGCGPIPDSPPVSSSEDSRVFKQETDATTKGVSSVAETIPISSLSIETQKEESSVMTSASSPESSASSANMPELPETLAEQSPAPKETSGIKNPLLEYPKEIQQGEEIFDAVPLDEETLQAMAGKSWKDNPHIRPEELSLCTLAYVGLDGKRYLGQLVAANDAALDLTEIFQELYDGGFPIAQMRLIDAYNADDSASMADNNTSAFCYREIAGTNRLSNHSFGRAVDINPVQNPYLHGGTVEPSRDFLDRENVRPGMVTRDGLCYQAFVSRGWKWGGDWTDPVDYQHFEKP